MNKKRDFDQIDEDFEGEVSDKKKIQLNTLLLKEKIKTDIYLNKLKWND